ncbi:hypothetical protein Moror_4481 [Moniliophthora roreri MCA 2997]|uniref:DUF202 domain-containing protein n=1 Tax=Moniliophthora roreri (strain MCA 2997) TaxID=1381753 RepID=V2YL72_MONRO|nr:hypothetical protein Moror_4481 [Moniliophthora roreri MCA 2997]
MPLSHLLSLFRRPLHRYNGHRADSFYPIQDTALLVELRARQRTFSGAYGRSALGNLGYSLTILRLFDKRFYKIGLLFAALAMMLLVMSFFRDRHSRHDFADPDDLYEEPLPVEGVKQDTRANIVSASPMDANLNTECLCRPTSKNLSKVEPIKSVGQGGRIIGRPFVTAGYQVLAVTGMVLAAEIALVVLIVGM